MSTQTLTDQGRFVSRLTRDTVALILAGGRGSRLSNPASILAASYASSTSRFPIVLTPVFDASVWPRSTRRTR